MLSSHKELIVWQKAFLLCKVIFLITKQFPKEEQYGLVSQMRRAAVSIVSNIAEGYARGHRLEYIQFLRTSFGSAAELETQLLLAKDLEFINKKNFDSANDLLIEVLKMLNKLLSSLQSR